MYIKLVSALWGKKKKSISCPFISLLTIPHWLYPPVTLIFRMFVSELILPAYSVISPHLAHYTEKGICSSLAPHFINRQVMNHHQLQTLLWLALQMAFVSRGCRARRERGPQLESRLCRGTVVLFHLSDPERTNKRCSDLRGWQLKWRTQWCHGD